MSESKAQGLIDGLQSLNVKTRIQCAKELRTLCELIGPEKTERELIEFLCNNSEENCDVLKEISCHLNFLIHFIQNVNECVCLHELIFQFLIRYEKELHANGYNAYKLFLQKSDAKTLVQLIYPHIAQMTKSQSDNYRIAVSKILPLIIEKCLEENFLNYVKDCISFFLRLSEDPCILVRKACCDKFAHFLRSLQRCCYKMKNDKTGKNEITQAKEFSKEEASIWEDKDKQERSLLNPAQDIEKEEDVILLTDKIWEMAKNIYNNFISPFQGMVEVQVSGISVLSDILEVDINFIKDIEQVLTGICHHENWRVRAVLANHLPNILKTVQTYKHIDVSVIVLCLLKDVDGNVRSIILENLYKIFLCTNIRTNILAEIFEDLKRDADSNNVHLKISLCKLLCVLPDFLDTHGSIEYILPLLLLFIRIEETELKSELFLCLDKISKLISYADMKQILIPLSSEILKSKNWRLRYSLFHHLKKFDEYFFIKNKDNTYALNSEDFWNIMHSGATDVVYSIRMETLSTIEFLMKEKSFHYFEQGLLFLFNDLKQSPNYLLRITTLHYISRLVKYFSLSFIRTHILPILGDLSKDRTSNVRLNIVKTIFYLNKYVQYVSSVIKSESYEQLLKKATEYIRREKQKEQDHSKDSQTNGLENEKNKEGVVVVGCYKDASIQMKESQNHSGSGSMPPSEIDEDSLFFICTSSFNSLSYYDNMKNIEANKKNCEFIASFLSNLLNVLCTDKNTEISKASHTLKENEKDFFSYLNYVNTFNTVCKPIK